VNYTLVNILSSFDLSLKERKRYLTNNGKKEREIKFQLWLPRLLGIFVVWN
jgi:hypothetical protein